jgi:UDP-N-acetylmuramate dehydrogenase
MRIGGRADWFIEPQTISEWKQLLELVKVRDIPRFILGRGSNVLVSDRGVRGLVIHLSSVQPPQITRRFKSGLVHLEVGAGLPLSRLIRWGIKNQVKGLEFLTGIPGSMGGAWAMNAGSYGRETKGITLYLNLISSEGRIIRKRKKQLKFSYRCLELESGEIVHSGGLGLSLGKAGTIKKEARSLWSQRKMTQPFNRPSCGSVFKNPSGNFAGRLIEEAGLKGIEKGGARISEVHANFIVNQGGARAVDVLYLMNLMRTQVLKRFGVLLEPEVRLWGCALKELG